MVATSAVVGAKLHLCFLPLGFCEHGLELLDRPTRPSYEGWSMFNAIVCLDDPDYLAAHPVVDLIHEDARYTARMACFNFCNPFCG